MVFYFKDDFDFDDFFSFFQNFENAYKVRWGCIEFFDKNIKVAEIFAKKSFLRSFRDVNIILGQRGVVGGITETFIDCKKDKFLLFIKHYKPRKIKLIIHFYNND